jgi:hypothetical protein
VTEFELVGTGLADLGSAQFLDRGFLDSHVAGFVDDLH